MKLSAAIAAMEEGKKVRKSHWGECQYILLRDNVILDELGEPYHLNPDCYVLGWEIYDEPIPNEPKFPTEFEALRKEFIKLSNKHDLLQKQIYALASIIGISPDEDDQRKDNEIK